MGYDGERLMHALPAAADYHASQYCAITVNGSGQAALAGAAARINGVLQNTPNAAGQNATYAFAGVTSGKAGAAITVGDPLETDSSGQFISSVTTGHLVVAVALASASGANSIIPIQLIAAYAHA